MNADYFVPTLMNEKTIFGVCSKFMTDSLHTTDPASTGLIGPNHKFGYAYLSTEYIIL